MPIPGRSSGSGSSASSRSDRHHYAFEINPLRGYVCLSILLMHLYFAHRSHIEPLIGSFVDSILTEYRLGFESFFILAGFFLAHSFRKSESNFLSVRLYFRRRFLRLAIPYWITLGLAAGLASFRVLFVQGNYQWPDLGQYLAHAFFIQDWLGYGMISIVFWSMSALFQYYLLWSLTFWLVRKIVMCRGMTDYHERTERIMAALTFATCIGSGLVVAMGLQTGLPIIQNGYLLGLGALCYWAVQQRGYIWLFFFAVAGLLALAFWTQASRVWAAVVMLSLVPLLGYGYRLPNILPVRILSFLGERSFSIYLLHSNVGSRVLNLVHHIPNPTPEIYLLVFLASVGISILVACLFYRWVEQPLHRLSRVVDYRKPQSEPKKALSTTDNKNPVAV